MAKRLFLLLISSLIELAFGANYLSATDTFSINAPGNEAVETVIEPEIVENNNIKTSNTATISGSATSYSAPVGLANYTVTSVTEKIVQYPSYSDIYRTGKFLYAHDSSNLFGSIVYYNVGDTITITEGGVARKYVVADRAVYEKINGLLSGSVSVTKDVEYGACGHDLVMMTCYGAHYGNGDASHRLVLFLDAV